MRAEEWLSVGLIELFPGIKQGVNPWQQFAGGMIGM
jgi:hypothetical protein